METIDRNKAIKDAIVHEKYPILPFELDFAKNALAGHIEKQADLGRQMGEAMQQSSETWHDNAPAEAISNESKTLASSAEKTMQVINDGQIFEYDASSEVISLGSMVSVTYGNDTEIVKLFVTGVVRELPLSLQEKYDGQDVDCVTISSPVGKAIFDKKVGDVVNAAVGNGRQIKLTIVSVSNEGE